MYICLRMDSDLRAGSAELSGGDEQAVRHYRNAAARFAVAIRRASCLKENNNNGQRNPAEYLQEF